MKDKITFKIGDNIITNQNIMGSQNWVEVYKHSPGIILSQVDDFSPGIKRWIVKFENQSEPIMVFENEIDIKSSVIN